MTDTFRIGVYIDGGHYEPPKYSREELYERAKKAVEADKKEESCLKIMILVFSLIGGVKPINNGGIMIFFRYLLLWDCICRVGVNLGICQ